jgi:Protein of unknown function (DUF2868)
LSAVAPPAELVFDEDGARRVVLVRAFEAQPDGPLWTAEDADWATRQALASVGSDAPPSQFIDARARHALQRLLPRDAAASSWLAWRGWRPAWLLWAALAGAVAGVAADRLGGSQHINLLAPPVWAVLAWNLAVYALLLVQAVRSHGAAPSTGLRRWLTQALAGGRAAAPGLPGTAAVTQARADWALSSAPLLLARFGALLHLAAAALALGLLAGLYLRGLVLDIRVGWQSTFLGASSVHALLTGGLAPASALTGIAVPAVETIAALQLAPGAPASASAAPWLHLYAATLALGVIVPRTLLAAWALLKARRAASRWALPLDVYLQRLLRRQRGGDARVQLLPHAAAVGAPSALGLRTLLAGAFGPGVQLKVADPTAFGDEDRVSAAAVEPGAALRVALFELGATPEADSQGRFVQAMRQAAPGVPLLMVVDEAGFARRFGALADRMAERRAAWQRLADDLGCAVLCVDLDRNEPAQAAARLDAALAQAQAQVQAH